MTRTSPDGIATHRRRRRWAARPVPRLRDRRVATKVAAVVAIPALAFVVVAGIQAGLSFQQAAALGESAERVALGRQVTALVHELQFERDLTSGALAAVDPRGDAGEGAGGPVAGARQAVDQEADEFRTAAVPLRDRTGPAAALAAAEEELTALPRVRTGVDEGWLRRQAAFDAYTQTIDALLALLPPPTAGHDAAVRGYRELTQVKELRSRIRGQVYAAVSAGQLLPDERQRLVETRAQRGAAQERFRADAGADQLVRFDEVVRGQAVRASARLEQAVLQPGDAPVEVAPQQWWSAATTELEQIREVETRVLADVQVLVDRDSRDHSRQSVLVAGLALSVLLVSVLLSVVIARSMVQSLRLLRRQAVDVAQSRLPGLLEHLRSLRGTAPTVDPVARTAAGGRDEVGEVAEAFTLVHRSAVGLAVDQAQMRHNVHRIFVNLARRSQVLVERQLEQLDELEQDERDPDRLESLFKLDHLATRMRRNNDSLLILTDTDPAHRYARPVPLASVTLAAIAEIERYQRVRDDVPTELHVVGHVVGDLVHLLAELLDNATSFSPWDTVVQLAATRSAGSDVEIEVTDAGMGMSGDAVRGANALLADPPPIDVTTSEQMGLVVVGHLAARHGLTVHLDTAGSGVRATVRVPARLVGTAPAGDPVAGGRTGHSGPPPAGSDPPPGGHPSDRRDERPRQVPVRAEDVLRAEQQEPSTWWSRPGRGGAPPPARGSAPAPPATPPRQSPAASSPPHAPAADGSDLPVRVPMAQLPATGVAAPERADGREPSTAHDVRDPAEPDPEEVGDTLSAFHRGVQRAESEPSGPVPPPDPGAGSTPGNNQELSGAEERSGADEPTST